MIGRHLVSLVGILLLATTACGAVGEPTDRYQGQPVAAANPASTTQATPTAQPSPGASSRPLDCDMTISASYAQLDNVATLAWVSHQVVTGMVVEELPPVWVYPDPQRRPQWRKIYTDYVVRVDQRLRGLPEATVRVRRMGGMIDGCTQQNPDEPTLAVGDRRLLFLHEFTVPNAPTPAYSAIGGPQGHWGLAADGTVTTSMPHYQQFNRIPLAQLAGEVRGALLGQPPATVPRDLLVPVDRAPLPTVP